MVCSNCNCEINDGATYCMECGAPIDEPVVLTSLKSTNSDNASSEGVIIMNDVVGGFINYSGYVKSLGESMSALVALLGAILAYLSPFFSWMWNEVIGTKNSANLFELGGKNGELALNEGVLSAMAVVILLSAIGMLALSACKYIVPLRNYEHNYIIRIIPVVTSVIAFVVVKTTDAYNTVMDSIKLQKEQSDVAEYSFDGGMGVGPILLAIGVVVYVISVMMDYSKRENNE